MSSATKKLCALCALLAVAVVFMFATTYQLLTTNYASAQSFIGPNAAPPNNSSALFVASSTRALGIGTSTVYSSLTSLMFRTLGGSNQHILFYPNGNVGIGSSTPGEKLTVIGNVWANSFIGTLSGGIAAANISSDVFGRLQGNGNFAFPASLGVATTTQNGLPQALSVYGGAYISGGVGIGGAPTAGYELTIYGSEYTPMVQRGNSGSAITIDWSQSNIQHVVLSATPVALTFTNGQSGARYTLVLRQDGAGNRTVTWPGTVRWPGGVAPTLTSIVNKTDYVGFLYNGYEGGGYYDNVAFNANF